MISVDFFMVQMSQARPAVRTLGSESQIWDLSGLLKNLKPKRIILWEKLLSLFIFYKYFNSYLSQNKGKESENSYQKLKRSLKDRHGRLYQSEESKSDAFFVVGSQTFTLFRLLKTAVPVEISRYSFTVFSCAYPSVISSISGKIFHFPFPYFVISVV